VNALEKSSLPFTGASSTFYHETTAKTNLKKLLIDAGVPTSPFVEILPGKESESVQKAVDAVGFPLFVKPSGNCCRSCLLFLLFFGSPFFFFWIFPFLLLRRLESSLPSFLEIGEFPFFFFLEIGEECIY
jgi:hypothetical protein